ncbi:MAG: ABC-F family ATP-binding cassette domain-containing protein [Actinobacteria bacterium]|nr:ABC-F family ATP-binding cassette domain-containing protein [Actinomycetota bacterium]
MSLHASQLRIEIGARVLLEDASFQVKEGEKVALVGPNGAGKTTLLRTLAGELAGASGTVARPEHFGWLPQDTTPRGDVGHLLTYDHLLAASPLARVRDHLSVVQEELHEAGIAEDASALDGAVHRYGELEERFRLGGGYELEPTAERIAGGLGLDEEALLQEVGSLSGGQRRRLELARLLLAGADVLIMDEPTNHLDAEAKSFVMNFLRTSRSALLVVSHDIELMSESIDRVFALERGRLDIYRGTYSQFLDKRAQREAAVEREATNAQREIARLQRTADKFRQGNATSARRRRSLEQRIGRITDQQAKGLPPVKRRVLTVRFPEPARAGDRVLTADGITKRLGDNPVLLDIGFTVGRGEVFLAVGPNGAGKTTLLRCLAGVLSPDAGVARFGSNVTVGYYSQEHEDIPAGVNVLQLMQAVAASGVSTSELRAILGHFGLVGDVATQDVSTLSGGEKTKLSLARLVAGKANLLLLDEPTNNLDTGSREAVLAALQHFSGTVVLVSHDVEFVTQLAPRHAIVMPSGRLLPFDEEMLELVSQRESAAGGAGARGVARGA